MTTDFNNRNTIIASGKGLVALFPAGHLPDIRQAISGRQQQQAGNTFSCCVPLLQTSGTQHALNTIKSYDAMGYRHYLIPYIRIISHF